MVDSTFMNASVEEEGNIRQSYDIRDEKIYPYVLLDCIIDLDEAGFMQHQGIEVIRNGFMHRDLTVGTFHSELTDSNDEAIGVDSKISFGVDENGVTAIGNVTVGNENAVITKSLRVFNLTNLFKHINVIDDAAYSVSLFTTEGYGGRTSSDEADGSGSYMQFGYEGVTHDFFHITRTDASVLYSSGTDADNSTRQQSVFMNTDYIHFYNYDDSGTNRYFNSLFVGDAKKLRKSTGVINSADSIPDYPNSGQIVSLFNPNIGVQLLNETANPLRVVGKSENKTVGSGNEKRITLYGPAVTLTFGESSNLGTNYWGLGSGNSISRNAEIRVAKVINVGNGTNSNPEAVHFVDFSTPIGVQDAIRGTNGTLAIYPWTYDGKVGRIDLGKDASITSTGRIYEYGDTIDIGSTYKGAGTNTNRLYMGKAEDMGEYIGSGMTIKKDTDVTVWRNSKAGIALTDTADTNRKNANLRVVGYGDVDNDAKYIYGPHISFMDGLKDKTGKDESFWGSEYIKTRFAKSTDDNIKGIFFDIDSNIGLGGRDGKSTIFSRTGTLRFYNENMEYITDSIHITPYNSESERNVTSVFFGGTSNMEFNKGANVKVGTLSVAANNSTGTLNFGLTSSLSASVKSISILGANFYAYHKDYTIDTTGTSKFNFDNLRFNPGETTENSTAKFVNVGSFRNIGRISAKSLQILGSVNSAPELTSDYGGVVIKQGTPPVASDMYGATGDKITTPSAPYTKSISLPATTITSVYDYTTYSASKELFSFATTSAADNVYFTGTPAVSLTFDIDYNVEGIRARYCKWKYWVSAKVFLTTSQSRTAPDTGSGDIVLGTWGWSGKGEKYGYKGTAGWTVWTYDDFSTSDKISIDTSKKVLTKSKTYYVKLYFQYAIADNGGGHSCKQFYNISAAINTSTMSSKLIGGMASSAGNRGVITDKGFFFGCDAAHWIRLNITDNSMEFKYKNGGEEKSLLT